MSQPQRFSTWREVAQFRPGNRSHPTAKPAPKRVVILGAGFAGLYTAQALEKQLRPEDNVQITLVDKENYFLYTPMLPEVVAGAVETRHILTPLRQICREGQPIRFIRGDIQEIDLDHRHVRLHRGSQLPPDTLQFDHLVITLGSTVNLTMVPGASDHALPLKQVCDALMIRNRMIEMFELADVETDAQRRREMLTFVVAGGGFSGVEVAGALQSLSKEIAPFYCHIDPSEIRIIVVEGRNRILGELPEDLAAYAQQVLEETNLEFYIGQLLKEVDETSVLLSSGMRIPARTVIWTTGVAMEPLIACLPCEKDQRLRLIVNEYLELQDYPNIWSLGDCALIPDVKKPGQYMPPTAQNAVREARVAAKNILAVVRNQPEKREVFSYQPIGEFVMLGEHSAVAVIKGHKLKGILAWVLWRTFYLWRLPSWPKKIRVALDWLIDAFTARDTTQIKLLPTELVESKIQEIEEGKPMGRTEPFKYRHTA